LWCPHLHARYHPSALSPIRLAKSELRERMRAARAALTEDQVATLSARAAAHVLALPEIGAARTVALYAPIAGQNEIETAPIHDALAARGATLAYPRVIKAAPLEFHRARARAELAPSALRIPQPPADAATRVPVAEIEVFVIPGLAFGAAGERLGWGGGHYDRTLAVAAPAALRIGYGYDFQVVGGVPEGADDERVDIVITESGRRGGAERRR
jgi:5-formyltetrahydrofolate cyclo-ligase